MYKSSHPFFMRDVITQPTTNDGGDDNNDEDNDNYDNNDNIDNNNNNNNDHNISCAFSMKFHWVCDTKQHDAVTNLSLNILALEQIAAILQSMILTIVCWLNFFNGPKWQNVNNDWNNGLIVIHRGNKWWPSCRSSLGVRPTPFLCAYVKMSAMAF